MKYKLVIELELDDADYEAGLFASDETMKRWLSRTPIEAGTWTMTPITEPGLEPTTYSMCPVCGAVKYVEPADREYGPLNCGGREE